MTPMNAEALARAGRQIAEGRALEDAGIEALVDELERAGAERNVELAAVLGGVTRRTLYQRLDRRRVKRAAEQENATTTTKGPA